MTVRWFFTFSPSKLKHMPWCFESEDSINFCHCGTFVAQKWFPASSISSLLILSSWAMQGLLLKKKLYFLWAICCVNQQCFWLKLVDHPVLPVTHTGAATTLSPGTGNSRARLESVEFKPSGNLSVHHSPSWECWLCFWPSRHPLWMEGLDAAHAKGKCLPGFLDFRPSLDLTPNEPWHADF